MASNNNIDVMGILNSITSSQTLARAEQIEITRIDGSQCKIPAELCNNVRMMTSSELVTFMLEAVDGLHPEDRIFICSVSEHSEYDAGHFYLYNGATRVLDDITPAMGGGEGGGGGSSNVKLSVPFNTKEMDANKEFTINFTWSSRNTGRGQVICTIDNLTDKTIMMVPGTSSWTIKGLSRGTHVLRIIAVDSSQMQSTPWTFEIKVGSLSIESSFSQNKIFNVASPIDIGYKYFTNEPTKQSQLIYTIDDEEGIEATGKPDVLQYKTFDGLSAGEHTITLKIRQFNLDENEEQIDVKDSNILSYTIIVAEAGVLYLTIVGNSTIAVTERDRVTLPVKVTYIGANQFAASLHVYKNEGLNWVEDTTHIYGVDTTWDLGVNQYITTFQKEGAYRCDITVSVSVGSSTQTKTVSFIVTVSRSALYTIDPIVDTSLLLHLSASGKTNNDVDRTIWKDTAIDEIRARIPGARLDDRSPVNVELNNFNWGTNGWFKDDAGHSYLNLNSGAYAVINIEPFADEIGTLKPGTNQRIGGLTFDIEYETEDVLYNTAKVVSCYDGDVGFWIDTEYATLLNNNSEKEIKVTEKDEEDTTEILAYEPKLDGNGDHIYIDAVTGAETMSPTTMVAGVETQNQYATSPVYAHYIRYTQVGPFQTNFPSKTKTRITFVIQRGEENGDTGAIEYGDYQFPCMCIYVNGVLTSVEKISNSTSFYQSIPRKIYLGCDSDLSNTGKASIYNVRLYNRALSMTEVLTNYVADFEDAQEQNDMIERNALGDAQESNSLPIMEFYVVEDEWNRMSKDTKIFGRLQYVDSNNLAKQIYGVNMRCQWQGTSTLAYAVKNLKIRLYDSLKYNKTGDALKGDRKYKYDLGNGIPEYVFTLKADYMDSMHGRNTAIANFVSNLRNGAADEAELTPPQEYKPACRTSIYGFPVQLYVTKYRKATFDGADLVFDPEDRISRELYGVYNFNLDKNSTDSLGLETKNDFLADLRSAAEIGEMRAAACEENYPKWDCMSFEGSANSDIGAGAFNSIDDVKIHSEFELRFEDEGDIIDDGEKTSTGSIMVLNSSGDYVNNLTGITLREGMSVRIAGINSDINGDYVIAGPNKLVGPKYDMIKTTDDILTNLDGNYTVDYGFTYNGVNVPVYLTVNMLMPSKELIISSIESAESRVARRYIHLKKFIKWVYDTPEEEFKRDLHKHVDVNAVLDYYTTVLVLLLADNFGKNVMWDTWGPISENRKRGNNKYVYSPEELKEYDDYIWYPHFYDCDTCLGLDNSGNMRFDVSDGLEYNEVTGKDDIAQGVFNTSKSKFWTKFRNTFADEIKGRYSALRSYDNVSDVATRRSTYTVQSFNEYFYDNQISKISEAAYNKDFKEKYLKHDDYLFMMHGRQYEFFQRFISQRLYFLDTFFGLGDSETKATIRVEYNDFATVPVIFDIKTYQPSYVTVKFTAASNEVRKKVPRNTTVRFEGWVNTATDQEVLIFNAPNIKSFGDVSRYSPKTVDVSQMTKLTEISVGTKEYSNYNLTSLALGSNQYLTKVVAENCGAMNTALDVSGCTNLKYISTEGSTIPNVEFNINGGSLEEAHFSYNTRSVSLHNFNLLKILTFEEIEGIPYMNNISQLEIVDCPLLLGYIDPDTHQIVDGYLAGNILDKWEPTNKNIRINLPNLYGKMGDYLFLDACATLHELYDLTGKNIVLSGQIDYMGEAIPTKYSTYKEYFPNLHITYENVTNFSEMFKNYKNINSIITKEYIIEDPITHMITRQNRKYWLDPKYDKYPGYATDTANFDKIGNTYYRKLTCYDEDDQERLAWEIRDRLSPFTHASDFSEMFMGDAVIEKIYDDTFDNFEFSDDIVTISMFEGCTNLKYVEVPPIKNINSYMFKDCPNTVVYLPKEVENISNYAFQNMSATGGQHHLVLFEGNRPGLPIDNIKDARFNIKKYGTGVLNGKGEEIMRAMKTEYIQCWDLIPDDSTHYHNEGKWLKISYFSNATDMKLIYNIENLDQISMEVIKTPIQFRTWNIDLLYNQATEEYTSTMNTFGNPLNIDEMLYGSMHNFDHTVMKEMTIPAYSVAYTSEGEPAYTPEELSFIKLFMPVINDITVASTIELDQVNLLMDTHTSIPKYMFKNTNIKRVYTQDKLRSIGAYAFEASAITTFDIENWAFTAALKAIGDYAFAGTMLEHIIIPDTVTTIGEGAFRDNKNIKSIRYSSAMRSVPISCFAECNDIQHPVYSISGFSPDIEAIEAFAFDKSTGLMLVTHDQDSDDPYECHWAAPSSTSSADSTLYKQLENSYVFLNYFRNLKRIDKFALRGIGGIRTIKINPMIKLIGAGSLIPPDTELTIENIPQTKLLWEMGQDITYSGTTIQEQAFLGRDFIWHSNIGGFEGDISHTVFVPATLGSLESYVFSPTGGGLSGGSNAKLEYVLSDALSLESIGLKWSPHFAVSPMLRESVFNYKTAYIDKSTYGREFIRRADFDVLGIDNAVYDSTSGQTSGNTPHISYDRNVTNPSISGASDGDIFINICDETPSTAGRWYVHRFYSNEWNLIGYFSKPLDEFGEDPTVNNISAEFVYDDTTNTIKLHLEIRYNLHYERDNALYFLMKNSTAIYVKLLELSASVVIPDIVTFDGQNYAVKKIANAAFIDNGAALNSITFATNSTITSIGGNLFSTSQINRIEVADTNLTVPATLVSIGSGTPFKDTMWFAGQTASDFVYLNDVCLGYSSGEQNIELENNPEVSIRSGTKIIYDNAFKGRRTLTSLALPTTLERIETSAFEDCNALRSIDFHPCANKLNYIGDSAFKNCLALTEMTYTKKITHVGKNAMNGNAAITKYVFEKDCSLDSTSDPIYLSFDPESGLNVSITDLRISSTMGSFFAPGAPGEATISKLSQLKTLILGEYTPIDFSSTLTTIDDEACYVVDLSTVWPSATYTANGVTSPVVLTVNALDLPGGIFYKASGDYDSAINIGGIARNSLKSINVIQTAMGLNPNLGHPITIMAKSDVTGILSSSQFKNLLANRVTTIQVQ